jgi:lipoate-protein ligase B
VWVDERKIASIGVHFSRGVTTHGFAVNVDNDLAPFGWVVACGLPDVRMTSLSLELGASGPRIACFRKRIAFAVAQALGSRQRIVTHDRLVAGLLAAAAVS